MADNSCVVLHTFQAQAGDGDGAQPVGSLNIYPSAQLAFVGRTHLGGASNLGTIFSIDNIGTPNNPNNSLLNLPNNNNVTLLSSFTGKPGDGAHPRHDSMQMMTSNGNAYFYGLTVEGGTNDLGTVYQTKGSGSGFIENAIHSFQGG